MTSAANTSNTAAQPPFAAKPAVAAVGGPAAQSRHAARPRGFFDDLPDGALAKMAEILMRFVEAILRAIMRFIRAILGRDQGGPDKEQEKADFNDQGGMNARAFAGASERVGAADQGVAPGFVDGDRLVAVAEESLTPSSLTDLAVAGNQEGEVVRGLLRRSLNVLAATAAAVAAERPEIDEASLRERTVEAVMQAAMRQRAELSMQAEVAIMAHRERNPGASMEEIAAEIAKQAQQSPTDLEVLRLAGLAQQTAALHDATRLALARDMVDGVQDEHALREAVGRWPQLFAGMSTDAATAQSLREQIDAAAHAVAQRLHQADTWLRIAGQDPQAALDEAENQLRTLAAGDRAPRQAEEAFEAARRAPANEQRMDDAAADWDGREEPRWGPAAA